MFCIVLACLLNCEIFFHVLFKNVLAEMFEEAVIFFRMGKKKRNHLSSVVTAHGPWTNRRIPNGPKADQSRSWKACWAATCFAAAGDSAAQGIRILWAFWFLGQQG